MTQQLPDDSDDERGLDDLMLRASLAFDDLSSAVQTQFRLLVQDVEALSPALADRLLAVAVDIADEVSAGTIQYTARPVAIWTWPEPTNRPDALDHELWMETRRRSEHRAQS